MNNKRLNGEELRLIRTLRNARVVDVANVIDRAASAICYVEAGNRSLDTTQTQAVLNAYSIDEEQLTAIRSTIEITKRGDTNV